MMSRKREGEVNVAPGGREEEIGWDGEETELFGKRSLTKLSCAPYDQLARRVRDMRESRTCTSGSISLSGSLQRWLERGSTLCNHFPVAWNALDPLGLGNSFKRKYNSIGHDSLAVDNQVKRGRVLDNTVRAVVVAGTRVRSRVALFKCAGQ
ncbi:hypothetical protein NC651_007539 [Populus alba x Populus x berolinensis]|nr:hypothetical protein NC651_007539 [Populus alba x Populus x berolinensis]